MADRMSKEQRSALMAKVRSIGNRSTEQRVEAALRDALIAGWRKHPKSVLGCPDFYFPKAKLAVFVDGCYWHACPKCCRTPSSNVDFWHAKLDSNRRRDNRVRRKLRSQGFRVVSIWEHAIKQGLWLNRIRRMLIAKTTECES
jgi:DNA mismatch endonuclease (patch repair protein)